MLIARRQHTVPPLPCENRIVEWIRRAVRMSSSEEEGEEEKLGGCEEVGFVRSIERIREGEPGDERLVTGSFDAYVVGFEY